MISTHVRVDDVEDESELRRGIPVANKIYGTAQTINCGNYVYFLALEKLLCLQREHPNVVTIFTEELLNLHRGQGMDIYWRDTCQCPTLDEYFDMIKNKTGGLLRLAIKLMQECATEKFDFVPVVDDIGTLYQIRDDYMNLVSEEYTKNKSFCEDLSEGKFSFPIIQCHIAGSDADFQQLLNILRQRTHDVEMKKYALKIMRQCGVFEHCKKRIDGLFEKISGDIRNVGGNPKLELILSSLNV